VVRSPSPSLDPPLSNPPPPARFQKQFTLPSRSRGSYLITDVITRELPELREYKTGLLTLFIQHTSCALSLNENYDDDVRADMSDALDRIVPEDKKGTGLYRHDAEGSDDMPVSLVVGTLRGREVRRGLTCVFV
jgi:secondary thiamine-phosphate synthase enzyme